MGRGREWGEIDDETLTWTVRSLSPTRLAAILGVAFLALAVGWFGFGRPIFGLLGAAMILGSTADVWLGTRYRLDAAGASARTGPSVTAMGWGDVRRVVVEGGHIRLSPLVEASKMDAFRGVGLVTLPQNHDAVVDFVRDRASVPLQ